jgi:PAS domain-containing protein
MARMRDVDVADQLPSAAEGHLRIALDNMPGALAYTDDQLKIVFCNDRFREMYAVPQELLQPGRPYADLLRHLAENGYYGEGDVDAMVAQRVASLRNPSGVSFEDRAPDGRWYRVLRQRAAAGGTVTVMTDITEQKRAELDLADKEAQLHIALDNMPGALAYTDDNLNIVFCNRRFRQMYIVPRDLLQPGRPYADLLRYLAENGYYGEGDVDSMVAKRVESLRNPSGKSFEDHAPDGRWYRILRSRVAAGGTVTVMTDITEQKQAERDLLEATRRTEEANKLITEKNRVLEGLYQEIRDKNRQLEEQAAQIAEWNARLETRVTEQVAQIGKMSKLTRFLSPKVSDLIMSGDAAARSWRSPAPSSTSPATASWCCSTPPCRSRTTSCARSAWRCACARRSRHLRRRGRNAAMRSASAWASRAVTRPSARSASKAVSTTARSAA